MFSSPPFVLWTISFTPPPLFFLGLFAPWNEKNQKQKRSSISFFCNSVYLKSIYIGEWNENDLSDLEMLKMSHICLNLHHLEVKFPTEYPWINPLIPPWSIKGRKPHFSYFCQLWFYHNCVGKYICLGWGGEIMNRGDAWILGIPRARMPQGARTNHFARGPLGGSYGPVYNVSCCW